MLSSGRLGVVSPTLVLSVLLRCLAVESHLVLSVIVLSFRLSELVALGGTRLVSRSIPLYPGGFFTADVSCAAAVTAVAAAKPTTSPKILL